MLRGNRVVLRPIEEGDLPNYVRWFSDPEVLAYFGPYLPMNLAQEKAWYEEQNRNESAVNFACEFEGRHIGGGGLFNLRGYEHSAEVGLVIGEKTMWDQGLGRDMLTTLVAYGFDYLNLHRIYLRVFAANARAVKAYELVGFIHEGTLREAGWRHGRWQDMLIMGILSHEWRGQAASTS